MERDDDRISELAQREKPERRSTEADLRDLSSSAERVRYDEGQQRRQYAADERDLRADQREIDAEMRDWDEADR